MEWLLIIGGLWFVTYFWRNAQKSDIRSKAPSSANRSTQKPPSPKNLNVRHVDVEEIELSDEQIKIFNLLEKTSNHFYVTGKAGTGKSVLLRYFAAKSTKQIVVVSPTGIAALNVGGQTIHSLFKMPFDIDLKKITVDYKTRELLKRIDTVVIDEVSMVRVDLMEAISIKLQKSRNSVAFKW
jgi:tRNA(Met) C34 N-acetyltransferase TmcA